MNVHCLLLMLAAVSLASGIEIGISVEGQAPGGPLLITATAVSDDPVAENWVDGKTPVVSGPDGLVITAPVQLRWSRVERGIGRALWTIDPEVTREWREDAYTIALGGDATAVITLRTLDLDAERIALLDIRWKKIDGQDDAAMKDLDAWIDAHGGTVSSLVLKSDLLEQAGDVKGALDTLAKAMRIESGTESPVLLLRRQQRLLNRLWE